MKQVIKCAWCGEAIVPGDPITLYTPRPDFVIPDHAQSVCDLGGHRVRLVGCPRPSCADSGADYAGTWEMPGKVVTRQTAYEMIVGESVTLEK
ncbi:MAG: hypothetical protein KBC48_02715 [Candidatus Pacebacteria bacterium]|nr:hypothetical protein [Candidatus Paceibacterota bacterium]